MNREIDRKIAELMDKELTGYTWFHQDENVQKGHDANTLINWETESFISIPHYSSDWNAMRLLVEWLQGKGFRVEFNIFPENSGWKTNFRVYMRRGGYWIEKSNSSNPSASLALCNAVLSLPSEVIQNA